MNGPRIGSLFSGYGGLEMGVRAVLGGEVAWHVEFDEAPSRILEHRFPGVPNYGDITAVDWSSVEPVEVLTGGFPCQDVSLAGLRRGLRDGTRSGLWSEFAVATDRLRPQLVVIENVRGLLSAEADRGMESDPWNVGDGNGGPTLRALGAVLGDLAGLGYDARWCGIRAADAGAPHGRFRVFIVAYPAGQPWRIGDGDNVSTRRGTDGRASAARTGVAPDAGGETLGLGARLCASEPGGIGWGRSDDDRVPGIVADTAGSGRDRRTQDAAGEAVGRVASPRGGGGADPTTDARRGDERWRGAGLVGGAQRPGESEQGERYGDTATDRATPTRAWGPYEAAIRRWEWTLGRLAPAPTDPTGRGGAQRLSARLVEWMMGLPEGWVTAPEIGLTRNQQLKALGNGVVPQHAALAVRSLLDEVAAA